MSVFALAVVGSLIPCVLWLAFFRSRDKLDPEPLGLLVRLFLIGAIPVALIASIANVIGLAIFSGGNIEAPGAAALFGLAVLVAPVTEETLKYWGAGLGANRNSAFDEPLDGLIYGVTVGLGFAFAETVFYLLDAFDGQSAFGALDFCEAGLGCFSTVAVIRGFGSALLHALASGIAGFALSRKKEGAPLRVRVGWVVLAMLVHAAWNAGSFLTIWIPLIIFIRVFRKQAARSPHLTKALQGAEVRHHDPRIGYHTTPLPPTGYTGGPPPPGSTPPTGPQQEYQGPVG